MCKFVFGGWVVLFSACGCVTLTWKFPGGWYNIGILVVYGMLYLGFACLGVFCIWVALSLCGLVGALCVRFYCFVFYLLGFVIWWFVLR